MKIAYLNTSYKENSTSGGSTHIREFINRVTAAGHTIYVGQYNRHPKAMQFYVNNPKIIKDQAQKARDYALVHFDWEKNSKCLCSILQSIEKTRNWNNEDVAFIREKSKLPHLYFKHIKRNIASLNKKRR